MYSFDEFAALGVSRPAPPTPPAAEDYCTIMYTSGTTGDPKVSAQGLGSGLGSRGQSQVLGSESRSASRHPCVSMCIMLTCKLYIQGFQCKPRCAR